MITQASSDRLQQIFVAPTNGVVGIVDDLMAICGHAGLQIEWRDEHCLIRPLGGQIPAPLQIPARKSVFRAILARVAYLSDRFRTVGQGGVSPYGGECWFWSSGTFERGLYFHAIFINTAAQQQLTLHQVEPTSRTDAPAPVDRVNAESPDPVVSNAHVFEKR